MTMLKLFWRTITMQRSRVELLQKHLEEAEIDLAQHEHHLEYYQAVVPMVQGRIARLKDQIRIETAESVSLSQPSA